MQHVSLTQIVIMLLLFHLLTICGVSPKPHSGLTAACSCQPLSIRHQLSAIETITRSTGRKIWRSAGKSVPLDQKKEQENGCSKE
ncbi:hypothetical protein N8Z70_00855 [Candidatus Puniceispirillum sp.]|nr:hypothetical protein [bacterium]MDC1293577.1 hypothetical protein [Candidatus Puniceispirillum sp.]